MEESIENFVKSKDGVIYLTDWNKYHETPKISTLRSYMFNRHDNGFNKVIERTDYRVKINEREFYKWSQKRKDELENRFLKKIGRLK